MENRCRVTQTRCRAWDGRGERAFEENPMTEPTQTLRELVEVLNDGQKFYETAVKAISDFDALATNEIGEVFWAVVWATSRAGLPLPSRPRSPGWCRQIAHTRWP